MKSCCCWCELIYYAPDDHLHTAKTHHLDINCSKTFYVYMLKKTIFKKFHIGPD